MYKPDNVNIPEKELLDLYDVAVTVGRFQVPCFHEGHKSLLSFINRFPRAHVFLGVSSKTNLKNPLDYASRSFLVSQSYPDISVSHLPDMKHDIDWVRNLDRQIYSLFKDNRVILIGGAKDSFIKTYSISSHGGRYPTYELNVADKSVSGTQMRSLVKPLKSDHFRAGVIYANNSDNSLIDVCVDVIVTTAVRGERCILLGKKAGSNLYCLPGGFVDSDDKTTVEAAKRELLEETSVSVDINSFDIFMTQFIEDWRYDSNKRLLSIVYYVNGLEDSSQLILDPTDDLVSCDWVPLTFLKSKKDSLEKFISFNHLKIIDDFLNAQEIT